MIIPSGWKVSEQDACPDGSEECELPSDIGCSFKGCDPLERHHESHGVTYLGPEGRALRNRTIEAICSGEDETEMNIHENMENGRFVVSEEFPNLLAETRSQFEDEFLNTLIQKEGLNENKFDIFPNLVMKCTENQTWQYEDERLR
jgi:hypothetical protein